MCANGEQENREDKFLLQEHREIWEFVRKITDERNRWLQFYWSIILASFAALGYLYYYLIYRQNPPESLKLWMIASVVFFALTTVSIIVLQALYGLRKRSVEYRNKLNIIRAWFLNRNDSEFPAFLSQLQMKEEDDLRWGYLPFKPDQTIVKPRDLEKCSAKGKFGKLKIGIENCILFLFPAFSSLVAVALIFSVIHLILPSCRIFSSHYKITVASSAGVYILLWLVTYCLIRRMSKECDEEGERKATKLRQKS